MSTTTGTVVITIADAAGEVSVPAQKVQVVLGCSDTGATNTVLSTRNRTTLINTYGHGPLVQYGAMAMAAGGLLLAMRVATNTAGSVRGSGGSALTITAASNATPIVITSTAHGLVDGSVVTIASVGGNTAANGTFIIHVLTADTFSLRGSVGAVDYTSGGTAQFLGLISTSTGTSVPTLTGTPNDDVYFEVAVANGGTVGTAGIQLLFSFDRGATFGPPVELGTATTYVVPDTGLTLAFASGTMVTGDYFRWSTIAPQWNDAGLAAALAALQASPYAISGWGSLKVVGVCAGADATALQSASPGLEQLADGDIFTRGLVDVRDASPPAAWAGTGESESAWMTSILAAFASVTAARVCAGAGHYNMTSNISNAVAGAPRYRRPFGWALGCRQIRIAPQVHAGAVSPLGALAEVLTDPVNDPSDGFVYHDERQNPGLDAQTGGAGRFASATTRIARPGWFVQNPLMLSAPGSQYWMLPLALVVDILATVSQKAADAYSNGNVRLNKNGTIYELDGLTIETAIKRAVSDNMVSVGMLSGIDVAVDRDNNVRTENKINFTSTGNPLGYLLEIDGTIAFASG